MSFRPTETGFDERWIEEFLSEELFTIVIINLNTIIILENVNKVSVKDRGYFPKDFPNHCTFSIIFHEILVLGNYNIAISPLGCPNLCLKFIFFDVRGGGAFRSL